MIKATLAIVLLIAAILIGIARMSDVRPAPASPPPPAVQAHRQEIQEVRDYRDFEIEQFVASLEPETRRQMQEWIEKSPKDKSRRERREHWRQVRDILSPEQIQAYREIQKQSGEMMQSVQEERQEKMKAALGEAEYERIRELSRQRRAMVAERRRAAREAEASGEANR